MKMTGALATCVALGLAAQSNAGTFPFTGTFNSYTLVGIAIPLTGVNTSLASWPAYDSDLTTAGFQNLTFNVSGTVDITAGVVTGAVINQTSPLLLDIAGGTGYTHAEYNNISWTYTGGTTLPLTPDNGPNVTGTCTIVVPAGSGQCALQLTNLQSGSVTSAWNWLGIAPNFLVHDLFGGSGLFNINIGGAGGHPGVAWTVSGDNVTAQVTQGVPNATITLFTAYQGVFSLVTVGNSDGDGVPDGLDNCPGTNNADQADGDGDARGNACDNCRTLANNTGAGAQADSNGDGFGNRCDGDLNNNSATNAQDYVLFRQQLGAPSVAPTFNAADINANGAVNAQDYVLFRGLLGSAPGPGAGP